MVRAVSFSLLLVSVLCGLSARAADSLPPLSAPLGRVGDVVQPVPQGGLPGGEKVVAGALLRCDTPQAFFLERFFTQGALGAAEQIQDWLSTQPAVRRRLFGKADPLGEALGRARSGVYLEASLCPKEPPLSKDARLVAARAPAGVCKGEPGTLSDGGLWLVARPGTSGTLGRRDFTGAVLLAPAAPDAEDACRPRMSAAVYDAKGQTRLLYHADWSGEAQVEVRGDRCRRLLFRFDPRGQAFLPVEDRVPGCAHK
jgi:hypothetical protein